VVNGVYSFGYGEEGKTVKRAAEVVAVADGETKVFNYSTEHKPLLGDVQLSDGTYTWGSSSGPSDGAQFIGSANADLGNVTAIYIQNAPAKDSIINTIYHYHEEGIIGALSQNKECWQELTINGKTLSPRERLVSVPFALVSAYSKNISPDKSTFRILSLKADGRGSEGKVNLPATLEPRVSTNSNKTTFSVSNNDTWHHILGYMERISHLRSNIDYQDGKIIKFTFGLKSVHRKSYNSSVETIELNDGEFSKDLDLKLDHINYDYFYNVGLDWQAEQEKDYYKRDPYTIYYIEFDYYK